MHGGHGGHAEDTTTGQDDRQTRKETAHEH
jgi:hypothetical protein